MKMMIFTNAILSLEFKVDDGLSLESFRELANQLRFMISECKELVNDNRNKLFDLIDNQELRYQK